MLKIKFLFEDKLYSLKQVEKLLQLPLDKYGVKIVKEGHDILIAHNNVLKEIKEPTIIIERADSSIIHHVVVRNNIHNTLRVFKTTSIRPIELNNCQCRYHYEILNQYLKLPLEKTLPVIDELHKIKCAVPIPIMKMFEELKNLSINYEQRPINLNYYATARNNCPFIGWHRNKFFGISQKLSKHVSDKIISRQDWIKKLLKSKITVSPWGWGEMCYRDFDAMYCGSLLIKPNSHHVECLPDVYCDDCYVPCKADGSDLEEIIHEVLDNWEKYTPMRKYAREKLVSFLDYDKRAKDFAQLVTQAWEQK